MTLCISAGEADLDIKPRIFHLIQAEKTVMLEVSPRGCQRRLAPPRSQPTHHPSPPPEFENSSTASGEDDCTITWHIVTSTGQCGYCTQFLFLGNRRSHLGLILLVSPVNQNRRNSCYREKTEGRSWSLPEQARVTSPSSGPRFASCINSVGSLGVPAKGASSSITGGGDHSISGAITLCP